MPLPEPPHRNILIVRKHSKTLAFCNRCQHEWIVKAKSGTPKVCPKCGAEFATYNPPRKPHSKHALRQTSYKLDWPVAEDVPVGRRRRQKKPARSKSKTRKPIIEGEVANLDFANIPIIDGSKATKIR